MSRTKKILDAPKIIKEKIKDFNEERKKPKEPITTKTSMFSIVSWAFYDRLTRIQLYPRQNGQIL
jgi:hypothetical protein